jgi:DNA-binding response OmpR family regulator
MKILYIEDDLTMAFLVDTVLRSHGYEVEHSELGKPGMKKFYEDIHSWDAVIIDLELPDISGQTLIPEIAAQRPELPIVVYSGQSGLKHRFEIISTGAAALLSKPSSAQDLLDILKYVTERPPEPIR